jgi:hypothetical protein
MIGLADSIDLLHRKTATLPHAVKLEIWFCARYCMYDPSILTI